MKRAKPIPESLKDYAARQAEFRRAYIIEQYIYRLDQFASVEIWQGMRDVAVLEAMRVVLADRLAQVDAALLAIS